MKWIKLFESFVSEYDNKYIEDVCVSLIDYNLKLVDVRENKAIAFPKDKTIVTDINDFDMSLTYESLILSIKSIKWSFLINKESFCEDLDDIIYHLESKFNLKLECIFFNTSSPHLYSTETSSFVIYYKFLEDFKKNLVKLEGDEIKFTTLDIMFKKLNI